MSKKNSLSWGMGTNISDKGEVYSYGFPESIDPNNFEPDFEVNSKEEIQNHTDALAAWDVLKDVDVDIDKFLATHKSKYKPPAEGAGSWEYFNIKETSGDGRHFPDESSMIEGTTLEYVEIKRETDKAVLLIFTDDDVEYWFPKSRTQIDKEACLIVVEDWLLNDKPEVKPYIRRSK